MKKMLSLAAGCCMLLSCTDTGSRGTTMTNDHDSAQPAHSTHGQQSEFADEKYVDMGKKSLTMFASGNIDGWLADFADTATYQWSSGDSLKGKTAIASYWKDRRAKMVDSIIVSNDIWLPIKINTPQKGPDIPGVWLLNWHQVNSKYKNGKRLMFWVHLDMHYNSADKIDLLIAYVDRAPINKALGVK